MVFHKSRVECLLHLSYQYGDGRDVTVHDKTKRKLEIELNNLLRLSAGKALQLRYTAESRKSTMVVSLPEKAVRDFLRAWKDGELLLIMQEVGGRRVELCTVKTVYGSDGWECASSLQVPGESRNDTQT